MPIPLDVFPLPAPDWLDSTLFPASVGRPELSLEPLGNARDAGDENSGMVLDLN